MSLPLTRLVTELHRMGLPSESDADLLGRFVTQRDEAAFTAIVERHGPMVLRVCQRILGDAHTAEDAFQAAFLVLARRARDLGQPSALAGWLYGVAQRIALKARHTYRRVPQRSLGTRDPHAAAADPLDIVTAREMLVVLEEELQKLPELHRMAIVACCLEGHTRDETAAMLGCTTGALRGWLERGRARLQASLIRRGITLSVVLLTAEATRCSARAALMAATVRAALGTAPAEVTRLAALGLSAGKVPALPLVLLLALAIGAGVVWVLPATQPAAEKPQPTAAQPGANPEHVDVNGDPLPAEAIARIGSPRLRTGGDIKGLSYSADGKVIVSASVGGSIQIWNAATGKLRRSVNAPIAYRSALSVSAFDNEIHLFSDNTCRSFAGDSGRETRSLTVAKNIEPYSVRLALDHSAVILAPFDGPIHLIDLRTGEEKQNWKLDGRNYATAFLPNAKSVVIGGDAGMVRVFDIATGAKIREMKIPLNRVTRIEVSPQNDKLLAAGLYESPVFVYDLRTGAELSRIKPERDRPDVHGMAFSPDGRLVALGGQWEYCAVYETASGKEIKRFPTGSTVYCVAFAADGKTLLVGTHFGNITQWDVASGKSLAASASPTGPITAIRFAAAGRQLLTLSDTHALYDWKTGAERQRFAAAPGFYPWSTALSPDETHLASPAAGEEAIVILDSKTGKAIRELPGTKKAYVQVTRFSPNGKQLYSSSNDGVVRVWDVESGKLIKELSGHLPAPSVWVSPDGSWLATATPWGPRVADYDIRIWDTRTWRLVRRITPPAGAAVALAFSPVKEEIAVGCVTPQTLGEGGEVGLFDLRSGNEIRKFVGHTKAISGIAFSPDGRSLVTGSSDQTLRLWEIATAKERHRLGAYASAPMSPIFSPDGTLLAASSNDGPILVWDIFGLHSNVSAGPNNSAEARNLVWDALACDDAKAAFQTLRRLVRNPGPAVAILRERLKPAEPVNGIRLMQLFEDLDSAEFETRQAAFAALDKLGDRVETPLLRALQGKRSLESKRRIESLIEKLSTPTSERLARWRALEVLEQIANPDALELLNVLAAGDPAARQTREATQARDRLKQKAFGPDMQP
jgi:RNA polymerase sigma factor (sigma-70 family)